MRVLRVYPGANDPRHLQRELALRRLGVEVGLVLPERYGFDWVVAPVEPELRAWRSPLLNPGSIPVHLWNRRVIRRAMREFSPDVVDIHEEPYFPSGAQGAWAAAGRPLVMYTARIFSSRSPGPSPRCSDGCCAGPRRAIRAAAKRARGGGADRSGRRHLRGAANR